MVEYEIVCAVGGCEIAIVANEDMTDYKVSYREGRDPCMDDVADNAFDYFRKHPRVSVTTIRDNDACFWNCVKTRYCY